ncbi:hypothetical protein QVD17_16739 [Tagetes erecta]|uniref:Uncharacterized protein n=1 Tax=Tagetes erecta TaxID=13708 RepID=A0AAD8KX72_TARER|nr:hypothetical protein QVD17_16739 [Tagetes erecta]
MKNTKIFKELDAEYEKLKEDYEELEVKCNTLKGEKEVLERELEEKEYESSESNKNFNEEEVGVTVAPREITVYYTRSTRSKTVTESDIVFVPVPNEADTKLYNRVFLDAVTISQVCEEYDKCVATETTLPSDPNEVMVEQGEWEPTSEAIIVNEIPVEELHHKDPKR